MRNLKWLFWAAAAFLVQTQFSFAFGRLNITAVLVFYFGLKSLGGVNSRDFFGMNAEIRSAGFGALVGLSEDIISGTPVGPSLLSKGLIGLFTPLLFMDVIFIWTPLWAGIVIALFTLMDGIVVIGARMLFSDVNVNMVQAVQESIFQTLVNIPLSMILKPGKQA